MYVLLNILALFVRLRELGIRFAVAVVEGLNSMDLGIPLSWKDGHATTHYEDRFRNEQRHAAAIRVMDGTIKGINTEMDEQENKAVKITFSSYIHVRGSDPTTKAPSNVNVPHLTDSLASCQDRICTDTQS